MTENEFTYWAFLSYSQQDNCEQRLDAPEGGNLCWGDWLHEVLKTFPIPAEFAGHLNARAEIIPERIEPIFQDQEEQPGNASLSERIRKTLEQSKCLIVICSPRSAKSLQVNEAVRYFKQLGRGNRILAMVIAGEPNASDGHKPGSSPEDECFVPALRHPVKPDGTLDTSRRDQGAIFADARQGETKREILAHDLQNGEIELETAKIQLIAGLIGVGFTGLWGHERKRLFAEAQTLAREARRHMQETRSPAPEAQSMVLEAQRLEAQQQVQELRNQVQAAQSEVVEAQHQAQEALGEAAEARNQAKAAESTVLAAQQQALEAQNQLEEARKQVREAENKCLEIQNLPQDVKSQIQDAQNQAREVQSQLEAARNQARAAESTVLAAQQQVTELRNQVQAAQSKVVETQQQAQKDLGEAAAARNQAKAAESTVVKAQLLAREAQQQLEQARLQVREAESKFLVLQNQTRDAQSQIQEAQTKARVAQHQVQEIQQKQDKNQAKRRLIKVFAILAVLALMAANILLWQRKMAAQALAKAALVEARKAELASVARAETPAPLQSPAVEAKAPELAAGPLTREQIQQALQKLGGAGLEADRLRSLDELAARIPTEEISETLSAAAVMVDDQQRSHFQERLLDSWIKTNLPAAFDWSCQVTNADSRECALAKIIPALAVDQLTNTLARLNDLKPAPGEQTYTLLFQRWAAEDPVQAIAQRQQTPGQDADAQVLSAIMTVWLDQQPEAAWNWVKSQPDSETRNQAAEACIGEQARTDVPKALTLTELLPDGTWRNTVIAGLFNIWARRDLEAATTACQQLPESWAKEEAFEFVLRRRIETDPASAAETVKNLPAGDQRQNVLEELCNRWADTDAPAALTWAQSLTSEAEQVAAGNLITAIWGRKDPQAAMQFANQHPELSNAAVGEIAAAWSQRDMAATTNWVASLPDGEKKDAVLLALAGSTEAQAPKLAAGFLTHLTVTQQMTNEVQGLAGLLAKDDVASAVEWARSLKDESLQQAALSALSENWAQKDPKGMATYALGLPAGEVQTRYLSAACRQLARRDLPATVELLQQASDAALRQSMLEQAARSCDLPHVDQAAKYIAAMPVGDDQKAAIRGLLATWTPADPEAAVNWLGAFSGTNAQPELVQSVIRAWSQPEPAAVAKWLANLPAGTASEAMISAFLEGAAVKYPEYAAQWTQSVSDDAKRQQYQLQVALTWMKADPFAALLWLNGLDLEESRQAPKAP